MPFYGIVSLLKGIVTGPDITEISPSGDTVHYVGRVGGFTSQGVGLRTKLYNVLDLPPRIPKEVKVIEGERGILVKEFRVEWDVPKLSGKIPRLREQLGGR